MEHRLSMYELALDFYGLSEIPGEENNPEILRWARLTGMNWVQNDETAWCSIWINFLAWSFRLEFTGSALARSWLNIGNNIQDPQRGHLVIFWRRDPDSQWGHVGLVNSVRDGQVWTLGGNQNNQVNIAPYPESRVLGYRELRPKP